MRPGDLCSAFSHLAKFGEFRASKHTERLNSLTTRIKAHVPALRPRELAMCFTALISYHSDDSNLTTLLCDRANQLLAEFSVHDLTKLLHCLERYNWTQPPELMNKIITSLLEKADDLSIFDIVSVLGSLSHFKVNSERKLINRVCDVALPRVGELHARHISTFLRSLVNLNVRDHAVIRELCKHAEQYVQGFELGQASRLLHALSKLQNRFSANRHNPQIDFDTNLSALLCAKMVEKESDLDPRDIASILVAATDRNAYDKEVVVKVRALALANAHNFNSLEIGNILFSLARMRTYDEELTQKLCQVALANAHKYNPQGVAKLLQILVRLHVADTALVSALCAVAVKKSKEFQPQSIAASLQSLAQLHVKIEESVVRKLFQIAKTMADKFSTHDTFITLVALTKLGIKDDLLLQKLTTNAITKLQEVDARDISDALAAFATAGIRSHSLIDKLCEVAHKRSFNFHQISSIFTALSKFDNHYEDLAAKMLNHVTVKAGYFNPKDVVSILNALVVFPNLNTTNLVRRLLTEVSTKLRDCDSETLSQAIHAISLLKIRDEKFLKPFCEEVQEKIVSFTLPQLLAILQGVARLDFWDRELFDAVRAQIQGSEIAEFSSEVQGQLTEIDSLVSSGQPSWPSLSASL